jgi:hypothetical protein
MRLLYYIVTDEGLKRVSLKVIEGQEPLPQFANSRMKVIQALCQWEGDRLLLEILGIYRRFNGDGIVYRPLEDDLKSAKLLSLNREIARERREATKVTNFDLHRHAKQVKGESRWVRSREGERDAIGADLLGSARPPGASAIPLVKSQGRSVDPLSRGS